MRSILALLLTSCAIATCFSQTQQSVSPELLADRRVVFRLAAPKAQEVGVFIDSMKTGTQEAMNKNADGLWTVTLGPLKPGIYIYHFIVDGLSIADPVNPRIKLRAKTSASLLEVPGDSEYWEFRDVPHGNVEINFHKASALGSEAREVWVYTPPGYDQNRSKRYPVLYLLHGSNDTPAGWTTVARANFTMDNLLAEQRVREMIIVTPFGHAVPFGSSHQKNTPLFGEYLLKDVMPMIEQKYRVANGRQNRAIAGFSMGGAHAFNVGLSNLDLFSHIGVFSAGFPQDFENRYAGVLQNPKGTNKKIKLLWIACGKDDSAFEGSQKLSSVLRQNEIEHVYRATEGNHSFNVGREYFAELAPLLFR